MHVVILPMQGHGTENKEQGNRGQGANLANLAKFQCVLS